MRSISYKILFGALVTLLMCTVSCSDFLDKDPTDFSNANKKFYNSEVAIEHGLTGVYNSLHLQVNYWVPFHVTMDHWTAYASMRAENNTIGAGGTLNPDDADIRALWAGLYVMVARANEVISGAEPFLDDLKANGGKSMQYLAEARAIRAFAYYNLVGAFGDVPFFKAPATEADYKTTRTSKVVIMDFILQEFDEIAKSEVLPLIANSRGRIDRSAVYGLRARAALLAGSLDYGGKAAEYFRIAEQSANAVIKEGKRGLAKNFDDLFNIAGQEKGDVRNEMLFELMFTDKIASKRMHWIGFGQVSRNQAQTGRHPLQILADTYECTDGERIDNTNLYNPKKPQENRDPRFGSTFWMHGDVSAVNVSGTGSGIIKLVLDVYNPTTKFYNYKDEKWEDRANQDINSAAAWTSFANAGVGLIWKKFSNELNQKISEQSCNVPFLRYAEVLLTYAEAKIELNEIDESVYTAINAVRGRVNMPDVAAERKGNQDKMRQLVRRERKVELALEGLLFFDIRRWGIGDITNDSPSYGYPKATKLDDAGYLLEGGYKDATSDMVPNFKKTPKHDLNDIANYDAYKGKLHVRDRNRFWNKAFELLPIPQQDRDKNPNLGQNDGY